MKKAMHVAATALLSLAGCANMQGVAESNPQADELAAKVADPLKPFVRALYLEGERNAVLNFNHLGLAAMEVGAWDVAKKAFDQAILRIDSIYADDDNARRAKSVWNEEKVKDWKGEPYERAMAYYYRGLLYLKDGEYDNAAAAFRAADYQDTQAEQEAFQGDFGLMPFLAAWAQNCRGNTSTAKELYQQAVSKDNAVSALSLDQRFLVLVDSGRGPIKYGDGKHKEVLKFRSAPDAKDSIVAVELGGKELPGRVAGDVQFQAETRGGRAVDGILNGKAQWKDNTDTVGQVAQSVGTAGMYAGVMNNDNNMANFGALASMAGMFAQMAAKAMTPAADLRAWGSLPSAIYVVADAAPPPELKLGVKFDSGAGAQVKQAPLAATHQTCGIAWARTRSALAPQDGGLASISPAPRLDDSGRETQNAAFRSQLFGMF
jgi:tetratricopeptide (TPR) repeat protein